MTLLELSVHFILSIILIVGVYQFYFFCQRHPLRPSRELESAVDEAVPYVPAWVWIYSLLYYPAIIYLNLVVADSRQFIMVAFNFIILLFAQMVFFMVYPVHTPAHWRKLNRKKSLDEKFLAFVHRFDASSNCFPSMHVSVATLVAMHALPTLGPAAFMFPLLIAVSCLYTRQHYLVDLPAGALLGFAVFQLY